MRIDTTQDLKAFLSQPKQIVIVTHWSPDGDAIGSSLGLKNYLIQKQHQVTVITPNDYPSFLYWMEGNNDIIVFDKDRDRGTHALSEADLIFCLDFNTLKRIDQLGELVLESSAKKCLIDHHIAPEDFTNYMLHDVDTSSTCELVYDFINLMDDQSLINKAVANCLYSGIVTDTGSFRFPSTSATTHKVVAHLIEAGAENGAIHNRIYDNSSENKLRLLGFCLSEKLKVLKEYGTAYFVLSHEEQESFDYQKGDTEGVVNYALSIKGVYLAVFIVERDNVVKMSFRSKGDFDVNKFARAHFCGGGHKNAAGGVSNDSIVLTEQKLLSLLKRL